MSTESQGSVPAEPATGEWTLSSVDLWSRNGSVCTPPSPGVSLNRQYKLANHFFGLYSIDVAKRWDHIYKCYQTDVAKKYGFAELCFQCDKWITGKSQWHEHCQHHLDDYESLPVQLNPLFFRRTLASAGHCLDCLFDSTLPPTKRFQQFTIKQSWREHISAHQKLKREKSEEQLHDSKPALCPDLRCGLYFDSVKDL